MATPTPSASKTPLALKQTFYYGIAAMALLALAGPYPRVATGFVALLIVGVLFTHWKVYVGYLTPPQKGG
jgi:hypothetical protein